MTSIVECLAADWDAATLIGRIELPEGPTPVRVREGRVQDISGFAPTCADALARADDLAAFEGRDLGALAPVEPPVRFGFGSVPRRPAVTRVRTTVELGAG